MVDTLSVNDANALEGSELTQLQDEKAQQVVMDIYQSSLAPVADVKEEPAEDAEMQSMFDPNEEFDAFDTDGEVKDMFSDVDETFVSEEEQEVFDMFSEEEPTLGEFELGEEQAEEQYTPQTYEEFVQEEQAKDLEIDWTGFTENSTFVHLYEWARSAADDDYVPENSIQGRELAIQDINERLMTLKERGASHKLMDKLWNQKHKLRYLNQLDQNMAEGDIDVGQIWDAIEQDPARFGKTIVQELVNKPELVVIPMALGARTAAAVGTAARTMQVAGATQRVAQVSAGMGAAYIGGTTIGVIDRTAEYNARGLDVNALKILEQSQVDGILGMTMYGAGKLVTTGYRRFKTRQKSTPTPLATVADDVPNPDPGEIVISKQEPQAAHPTTDVAPDFDAKLPENQRAEANFQALREAQRKATDYTEVQGGDTITDVHYGEIEPSAPYIDEAGNVYDMDFNEAIPPGQYSTALDVATDIVDNQFVKVDSIKQELVQAKNDFANAFDDPEVSTKDLQGFSDKVDVLEKQLLEQEDLLAQAKNINDWHTADDWTPNKYEVVETETGPYTVKMMERQDLESGVASVTGIQGMDFNLESGSITQAGFAEKTIRTYLGSTLSYLRSVSKASPELQKLAVMLEVDTRNPTVPMYSLNENMLHNQGRAATKIKDIIDANQPKGRKAKKLFEETVRKHMRGVEISEDPAVLRTAEGLRGVLDESFEYLKNSGVKVGETKDYLPRHYKREAFKDAESAGGFINRVMEAENVSFERAQEIVQEISEDLQELGGVKFRMEGAEAANPYGQRSLQKITDDQLDDMLSEDFFASIYKHTFQAAKRAEMAKVFGDNGDGLRGIFERADAEHMANTGKHLDVKVKNDIEDAYNLLNGTYSKPQTGASKVAADGLVAFEVVTNLDMVTYSSLLEPMSNLFAINEGGTLKGLGAMAKTYYASLGGNKLQRAIFGETDLDVRMREAHEEGLMAGMEVQNTMAKIAAEGMEGWPKKITSKFIQGVGLHAFTEINRGVAYAAHHRSLLQTIQMLAEQPKHKLVETRRRWLMEANIDPEHAIKWYKEGANQDADFYTSVKRGAVRNANKTIANPNTLNKTKLTASQHPVARLVTLFKSFAQSYNKDVFRPQTREVQRLWNEGQKVKAMEKFTALTTTMAAMGVWMATKGDVANEALGGDPKDLTDEELAQRIGFGTASLIVPGAALAFSPLTGPTPLSGLGGPVASDIEMAAKSMPSFIASKVPFLKRIPEVKEDIKEGVKDIID